MTIIRESVIRLLYHSPHLLGFPYAMISFNKMLQIIRKLTSNCTETEHAHVLSSSPPHKAVSS